MTAQLARRTAIVGTLVTATMTRAAAASSLHPLGPLVPEIDAEHASFRAAFLAWLEGARHRSAFPITAVHASPHTTKLHIEGLHDAIWVTLGHAGGIDVGVTWDDVCWDLLISPDVYAEEQPNGAWRNTLMLPEYRVDHPTIEAAWRSDGFEMLLDWINDEVAPATHLGLWHTECGGATWARLVRNGQPMIGHRPSKCKNIPVHLLPLHAGSTRVIPTARTHVVADGRSSATASAVQRGSHVYLYDDRGRQIGMLLAGDGDEDGLKGYTAHTVTIRRGMRVFTYDQTGRQLSATSAR